jgi:tetratricopeptide (TPR) repeat protein
MERRHFNWQLASVLVLGFVVLLVTAVGLRQWQRNRRADRSLALGNEAYEQQQWKKAAECLGRYLAVRHEDVPVLLKYAGAQLNIRPLRKGNVEQAVRAYRIVLRTDAANREAAVRLTEVYLAMGVPAEAELLAKRHLPLVPDAELRRILALALARQRKFAEAAAELEGLIAENPGHVLAYEALGRLIEQRPEEFTNTAAYWFDEAVKRNPSCSLAYVVRASFRLRNQDRTGALADLEQAERQDISEPLVRLRLAQELIEAQLLQKAKQHLESIQDDSRVRQYVWQTRAELALKLGEPADMVATAEGGLNRLAGQCHEFLPIAAELFIRSGEFRQAQECIGKLRQMEGDVGTVAYLEGLAAEKQQRLYEAARCWQRAIESGSTSVQVRLGLAGVLYRLGDNQSALRQLRLLVSEGPGCFEAQVALARLCAETGRWGESAEHASKAVELRPESVEAVILDLQAQMCVAVQNGAVGQSFRQGLQEKLIALEARSGGAAEVKLIRLELAILGQDIQQAQAILEEMKASGGPALHTGLAEAKLLSATGQTQHAQVRLSELVRQFPQATEPVEALAVLWASQLRRSECEAVISEALGRITQRSLQRRLGLLLAELYTSWGEQDKAYELLAHLAQEWPDDVAVKRCLLRFSRVTTDGARAQQMIDEIKAQEGPSGWQWRYEQANLWFGAGDFQGRYPQIVMLLKENLLANPEDQDSRVLLACTYEKAGELQLAAATYREALNRSPQDVNIIAPALAALHKAGQYAQADEILGRVVKERPGEPVLSGLELESYLRQGKLESAEAVLERLVAAEPDNQAAGLSLALLRIRQKKYEEAELGLKQLTAQQADWLPVTAALVELKIGQGKKQEAFGLCDEAVARYGSAAAYILRAQAQVICGQQDLAAGDFQQAVAVEPGNARAWAIKSDFNQSSGQDEQAIKDIEKALALEPENPEVQKLAIGLLGGCGDRQKVGRARAILEKALAANPEDAELKMQQARFLLAEGTAAWTERAVKILQEVTETRPQMPQAWGLLGEVALRQGQFGKCIDIALRGLGYQPNDKGLLLLKARAEAVRSPGLAVPGLKALHELYPQDADVAVQLAEAYTAAGQPGKAVDFLLEQIRSCRAQDAGRLQTVLAVALYQSGDKQKAQVQFQKLLEAEGANGEPVIRLARLLRQDGRWSELMATLASWQQQHAGDAETLAVVAEELAATADQKARQTAEEILGMALRANPGCVRGMLVLGMLLQATGRGGEAAAVYRDAIELEPENVVAINNLAWIMCEENGRYAEALALAERGLQKAPDYADLIDTRGVAYYRLGQLEKAVQDLTRCTRLYPGGAPAATASYFHLGRALAGLGQKQAAVENLKKARELNSLNPALSDADSTEMQQLLSELSPGG